MLTYALPGEFITSRTATVRGWEVIEYADWIVHGASRDSPDAAQQEAVYHAKLVGANALVGLDYYKTTGSEPGSGRGTHHFTIHNFRGQLATFAKRTSKGPYRHDQLLGLNGRAESLKKELVAQTRASKRKQNLLWYAVLVLSIISGFLAPVLVIAWVVLGFIFGRAKNYDDWLERV